MTDTVFKPIQLRMIALMILVPYGMMAYPVYGMKRYGRSTSHPQNGWGMSSVMHVPSYYYQAVPRPQPQPQTYHPYSYYDAMNLYAPEYDDYYYPQESVAYPLYYPTFSRPGSSNYDFYQPFLPYYYTPNPYGYYENSDPMDDLQEEVLQEEEREQREEAYPIGQETWYEPDGAESHEDSIDDVNAAFMKNLMLYNNAMAQPNYVYGKVQPDTYPQQYSDLDNWNTNPYGSEDKDEQDLHMLTEAPKKQKPKSNKKQSAAHERMQMFNNNNRNQKNRYDPNNSESWLKYASKRTSAESNKDVKYDMSFTSRKPQKVANGEVSSTAASTEVPVSSTQAARDARGGQKEVMMMRPATPVRRPFSEPVMQLLAKQGGPERKRTPSVYDTIKHMLEMEKSLEKEYRTNDYYRPAMRKRYVSSEESLVEELAGLKKTAEKLVEEIRLLPLVLLLPWWEKHEHLPLKRLEEVGTFTVTKCDIVIFF